MKAYYEQDGITIYHGDCREYDSRRFDVCLTDPPYGVRKAEWDCGGFPTWCFSESCRLAAAVGIMVGVVNLHSLPHRVASTHDYKWCLIAHLVNGMTRGALGFANYIPCVVYSEPEVVFECNTDIRDVVVGTETKPEHPSPKPVKAIEFFLSRLGGESVVDPFMGSGTTLVVAKRFGMRAIGIEIEERYCEIAAKRLSQQVMQW